MRLGRCMCEAERRNKHVGQEEFYAAGTGKGHTAGCLVLQFHPAAGLDREQSEYGALLVTGCRTAPDGEATGLECDPGADVGGSMVLNDGERSIRRRLACMRMWIAIGALAVFENVSKEPKTKTRNIQRYL